MPFPGHGQLTFIRKDEAYLQYLYNQLFQIISIYEDHIKILAVTERQGMLTSVKTETKDAMGYFLPSGLEKSKSTSALSILCDSSKWIAKTRSHSQKQSLQNPLDALSLKVQETRLSPNPE